ncbi:MAG: DegT/DnrJ/EryC1/StrS family aminotransferase [Bryobacteraceae bacterium]|jgi:dTDP-4-amino-4,6-dideoxygalactose transaminase
MATSIARAGRTAFLPYSLPWIGEEEIAEMVDSLRSNWITTGPKTKQFEAELAAYVGAKHAIAVNSCTAALQIALAGQDVGPGDEVIVPTLTFCATANVVVHLGATPILADVGRDYQISVEAIERAITPRTKAIVVVHYGGQACDLDEILELAGRHGLPVVEDAAHAIGTEYRGRKIGTHGAATAFSFYATKNMTTGEGGAITTNDEELAARMRMLSLHGMSRDAWQRYSEQGSWFYEVVEAGFKHNMTDLQASLGLHQLRRLDRFIAARQQIARQYRQAFSGLAELILPVELPDRNHAYHLFAVRLDLSRLRIDRAEFIQRLQKARIGASVHFIPLHRHPFYRNTYGYRPDQFPCCEELYAGLLSLPIYPKMSQADVWDVIEATLELVESNRIG